MGENEAELAVGVIREEIAMMGANDMEIPAINELIVQLRKGDISPAEAIRRAAQILAHKQDYH